MKLVDHRAGQYRAEVFEELVRLILVKKYPDANIVQDYIPHAYVPAPRSIDFCINMPGVQIFVEAKASYGADPLVAFRSALKALRMFVGGIRLGAGPSRLILALASGVPDGGDAEIEAVRKAFLQAFAGTGVVFEVWDETKILELVRKHLRRNLSSLSTEEMESVVGRAKSSTNLPAGTHPGAIILMADFCSYSKFVDASGSDHELVSSIMGRLYRGGRRLVYEHGGILDKFMGDGLLAFWLESPDAAANLLHCVERLTGLAIQLAAEWSDRVDQSVRRTGMHFGAAIGDVLFIEEDPEKPVCVHAIGNEINLAARLQAKAAANWIVMSNRLKSQHFQSTTMTRFNPRLKNLGEVNAWKKQIA